jgi:hypothetical protein
MIMDWNQPLKHKYPSLFNNVVVSKYETIDKVSSKYVECLFLRARVDNKLEESHNWLHVL